MGTLSILSEHPAATCALGAFLVTQVVVFTLLYRNLRKANGVFDQLGKDKQQLQHEGPLTSWIKWCEKEVDADCHSTFDSARNAAMAELERILASLWNYLFLQRTSIMAPLLGVLITAGGFLGLNLAEDEKMPVRVIAAITPLVMGVGGGALLAFLNQFLLHAADTIIDKLRAKSGVWYDTRFRAGELEKERKRERSQELKTAQALRETTELNTRLINVINKTEERTTRHAEIFEELSKELINKVQSTPERLEELVRSTDSTAKTLNTLTPLISQLTGGFNSSVETFREVVENQLVDSLSKNHQITCHIEEIATSCKSVINQLDDSSSLFKDLALSQDAVTRNYLDALNNHIRPQQEELTQISQRLEEVVSSIASPLDTLSNSLQQFTDRLEGGSEGMELLRESAGLFSKAVADQFAPAAELHRKVMAGVEADSEHARTDANAMRNAILDFVKSAEDLSVATEMNREFVEQHSKPAHIMLERAAKEFERSAETMAEHADSYRAALISHSDGVSRLDDKVIEAVDAIQQASNVVSNSLTSDMKHSIAASEDVTKNYDKLSNKLNLAVDELQKGVSNLLDLSKGHAAANEDLKDAMLASSQAVVLLNATSSKLHEVVDEGMIAGQSEFREAVERLTVITNQLDRFLGTGVVALTERIHSLEGVFSNLRESVRGISAVANASKDAERFLKAMENAGALAESLERLPDQLINKTQKYIENEEEKNGSPKKKWSLWG